ncbi:DUF2007 domain-containing protein [Corallincola platygyrae]|uniref:DUF2007 domain-containing protein n=1 Tax=Corallincola platygyrae TaxID=1193278 RepID=A0ABW4XRJ4_9GAMM
MSSMKLLYEAANGIEANLLKGMLATEGIEVTLKGEQLLGAVGELPMSVQQVSLWVDSGWYSAARRLLESYERKQSAQWCCHQCGETNEGSFDLCWQCSQPKPE